MRTACCILLVLKALLLLCRGYTEVSAWYKRWSVPKFSNYQSERDLKLVRGLWTIHDGNRATGITPVTKACKPPPSGTVVEMWEARGR